MSTGAPKYKDGYTYYDAGYNYTEKHLLDWIAAYRKEVT